MAPTISYKRRTVSHYNLFTTQALTHKLRLVNNHVIIKIIQYSHSGLMIFLTH